MNSSNIPRDSRFLVDPQLVGILDAYQPFALAPQSLSAARARLANSAPNPRDGELLFPDVVRTELSVPGLEGSPAVCVLAYRSSAATDRGASLVWAHGGGMVLGSADNDDTACRQIASFTGLQVFSVDYRLAPETVAPGAMHDVYAAITWVGEHADELNVDPNRIAVGGSSAGAGIAASAAIFARDLGEIHVAFQALVFPMLDDRTVTDRAPSSFTGEFIWTRADNHFGWTSYLGTTEVGSRDVSPYAAAARCQSLAGLPAAFICVGSIDLFAEEDLEYARRLVHDGVSVELHLYAGGFHGYPMVSGSRMAQDHLRNLLGALDRFSKG